MRLKWQHSKVKKVKALKDSNRKSNIFILLELMEVNTGIELQTK